jgi:CRISPR system Cascade subunit CasC
MRHIELHVIQSFPVTCLNRDDLNVPKTAVFGGFRRARVSSQSWKRPIREYAKKESSEEVAALFSGERTRRLVWRLAGKLGEEGLDEKQARHAAEALAGRIIMLDAGKTDYDGFTKVKTLAYLSDGEFTAIAASAMANDELIEKAQACVEAENGLDGAGADEKKRAQKNMDEARKTLESLCSKQKLAKAINSVKLKDAADIAIFGRFVAGDKSLVVEAASLFGHALSTHKVDNEIDFFAAVDDNQNAQDSGAGITGVLDFNSAVYYRYAALNLDMLADEDHLGDLSPEQRKAVVRAFVESVLKAVPTARRSSMNGHVLPACVLGLVKEKGQPVQLVNAFEKPVCPADGKSLLENSVEAMLAHHQSLKETWGIETAAEVILPDENFETLLDTLSAHVV